jgi:hypothetical protein
VIQPAARLVDDRAERHRNRFKMGTQALALRRGKDREQTVFHG